MRQQAEKEKKLVHTDRQRNEDRFEIHEKTGPETNTQELDGNTLRACSPDFNCFCVFAAVTLPAVPLTSVTVNTNYVHV